VTNYGQSNRVLYKQTAQLVYCHRYCHQQPVTTISDPNIIWLPLLISSKQPYLIWAGANLSGDFLRKKRLFRRNMSNANSELCGLERCFSAYVNLQGANSVQSDLSEPTAVIKSKSCQFRRRTGV